MSPQALSALKLQQFFSLQVVLQFILNVSPGTMVLQGGVDFTIALIANFELNRLHRPEMAEKYLTL
jgi:hypothetical protein